ncbi:MAG: CocE/NonD family hydrolase [Chloroflexota bacterium]|nr:CocE/NonD family hydrolase [Chloroflexota bacterium]
MRNSTREDETEPTNGAQKASKPLKNEKPGFTYIAKRLKNLLRPPLHLVPLPKGMVIEKNVEIPMRDGVILRANVFRPATEGNFPVIMCAHPYGKDRLNRKGIFGPRPLLTYRVLNQPDPLAISTWTGWEAPDPAYWVPQGYVFVNIDLRGFGASGGKGDLFSDQEAQDYYECIEWAARQPWSNGKIGLSGVSYLAISQYKVAALNPPHLAAICPWEGFSDFYRDFAYPGGIREDGFTIIWGGNVHSQTNVRKELVKRPLRDAWYQSLTPDLQRITVPALVCGSFSDQSLHTQGSFRFFEEIRSQHKWLYTHRGAKWAVYYSPEALAFQRKFFEHFLKGKDNGMLAVPPVRLEVRDTGKVIHAVKAEQHFPPHDTQWTALHLSGETNQLAEAMPQTVQQTSFDLTKGKAVFEWEIPRDLEVIGPMVLKLYIEVKDASDGCIFAGMRKIRNGKQVVFEGSYGFGYDLVTKGWQRASLRQVDKEKGKPWSPEHDFTVKQPLQPQQIIELEFSLLPSATFFKQGDILRLDIQGRWFFPKNLVLYGPAYYEKSSTGTCVIYSGGDYDSHLLLPLL